MFPKIAHNLSFVEAMMLLGKLTNAWNSSSFNSPYTEKNPCIVIYYSSWCKLIASQKTWENVPFICGLFSVCFSCMTVIVTKTEAAMDVALFKQIRVWFLMVVLNAVSRCCQSLHAYSYTLKFLVKTIFYLQTTSCILLGSIFLMHIMCMPYQCADGCWCMPGNHKCLDNCISVLLHV